MPPAPAGLGPRLDGSEMSGSGGQARDLRLPGTTRVVAADDAAAHRVPGCSDAGSLRGCAQASYTPTSRIGSTTSKLSS